MVVTFFGTVCVLKKDGTVWTWGNNEYAQLGNGTWSDSNVPVQAKNLTNIIDIYQGSCVMYALKKDGTVWSWGTNESGQLGTGTWSDSSVPVQVKNLTNVEKVHTKRRRYICL